MDQPLDATIVDAWTEFIRLQEQGAFEDLDDKSRNIIYVVAAAEARGERINQKIILKVLKPKSHMPILSRLNALVRTGWLAKEIDPADRRMKIMRLTPKSVAMLNLMSKTIRSVVKPVTAIAAGLMAMCLACGKSTIYLYAAQVLTA